MRVTIIGSGNVAAAFASALAGITPETGIHLAGIVARNAEKGRMLAESSGVGFTPLADGTPLPEADVYVMAVKDRAIAELSESLHFPPGSVVAHTAGSVPLSELSGTIPHRAVIYPLQTFTAGRNTDLKSVPIFTEASTDYAAEKIFRLAAALSDRTAKASSAERASIHLAGAVACNLVNALYAAAGRIVRSAGFGFDILVPLITETALKAAESGDPAAVQTGAAARGDTATVERHISLLEKLGEKRIKETYTKLSEEIWQTMKIR